MEGEAFAVFDTASIDTACGENGFVFGREILADDGDDANIGKKACGEREVGSRATNDLFTHARRRFQRIKGDRANDRDRHLCSRLFAEVLTDDEFQFLFRRGRNRIARSQDRRRKGAAATASTLFRQRGYGFTNDVASILRILIEHGDDLIDGHVIVTVVPAIVVSNHGDRDVTELSFARELRFLKIGHADHIETESAVRIAFGFCRKLRAFHADVGSATFAHDVRLFTCAFDDLRHLTAYRFAKADVGYNSVAKKRGDALAGAIVKLVGNDEVGGLVFQLQRADGGDRNDALDSEL